MLIGKRRKEENCLGKKVYWWFLLGLIIVICKNTFLDRNAAVCCKKLALGGSQDFWLMLGLTVRQRSMAQPTNHLSTFVHCLFKVSAHICVLCLLFLWQESCGAAEWCSLPITSQSRWRKISQEPSLPTLGIIFALAPPICFFRLSFISTIWFVFITLYRVYLALPNLSTKKKHQKLP